MKKLPVHGKADPALTVAEAAGLINVSTRTIRSWIKGGVLSAFRIGGVVRIPSNAVTNLVGGAK